MTTGATGSGGSGTAGSAGESTTAGSSSEGVDESGGASAGSGGATDEGSASGEGGSGATDGDPGLVCTSEYSPVCGVDGETYDHPCSAIAAGVEIKREGPCFGDCEDSCTVGGSPATTLALALMALLVLRPRRRSAPAPGGAMEGASRGTRTPTPFGTGT
jgi:uncharacterized protein (TIGR03382 family)